MAGLALFDGVIRILLVADRVPVGNSKEQKENVGDYTEVSALMDSADLTINHTYMRENHEQECKPEQHPKLPEKPKANVSLLTLMRNRQVQIICVLVGLGSFSLTMLEPTLPAHLEGL